MTWNVTDITLRSIHFKLNFSHPLNISQSDQPDELLVLLNLHDYKTTKGASIPSNTVMRRLIPAQLYPETAAAVAAVSDVAGSSTTSTFGISFILNLLLSSSLS